MTEGPSDQASPGKNWKAKIVVQKNTRNEFHYVPTRRNRVSSSNLWIRYVEGLKDILHSGWLGKRQRYVVCDGTETEFTNARGDIHHRHGGRISAEQHAAIESARGLLFSRLQQKRGKRLSTKRRP